MSYVHGRTLCRCAGGVLAVFVLSFSTPTVLADNQPSDPPVASNTVLDQKGEQTTLKTAAGKAFNAYIVGPKEAARGVLLISASASLDSQARAWADHFGANGYRAITIDLGGGDSLRADGAVRRLDQNDANAKHRAALEALRDPGRSLAVIGWCGGGSQALEAALAAPDIVSAAVIYYGTPTAEASRLEHLRAPLLAVVTKNDADRIKPLQDGIRRAQKVIEVRSVDAPSPCVNPKEMNYERESKRPAWQAVSEFLNRHMK